MKLTVLYVLKIFRGEKQTCEMVGSLTKKYESIFFKTLNETRDT